MTSAVQVPKSVPDFNLKLRGHDLWSKHGFSDGDVIDEFIYHDPELESFDTLLMRDHDCTQMDSIVLSALVELYLLPKFDRPLTLYFASYSHNSVRVTQDEWWDWKAWPEHPLPEVEIESRVVMDMLYSVQRVFEAWIAKQPIAFPSCLRQTAEIFQDATSFNGGPKYSVQILDDEESALCWQSPLRILDAK